MDGEKISGILLYTVTGDALGSSLGRLGKEHIAASFKQITGYIDPMRALKGKAFKWRKPGLYSSLSQLNLIFALCLSRKRLSLSEYADIIADTPVVPDSEAGIFRWPDSGVKAFIKSLLEGKRPAPFPQGSPQLPLLMLHLGLFLRSQEEAVLQALRLAASICTDAFSVAGAGIYAGLIRRLSLQSVKIENIREAAVESIAASIKLIDEQAAALFNSGINPISLKHAAETYIEAFSLCGDEDSERRLISLINGELKTPVTRLTVPHPLALLSGSFDLVCKSDGEPDTLFEAAAQGGTSGPFTAAVGSFLGILNPAADIPGRLTEELVNRKRILNLVEAFQRRKVNDGLVEDFIASEHSLTAKFLEELKAKAKNDRTKQKQPLKDERRRTEEALAKHAVESWTKIDKAKWKKEKQRSERRNG